MVEFRADINQKIEVINDDVIYKSLIMDVDDGNIKINLPVNNGEYLVVSKGEELEFNTYAGDGKCFYFKSKVIDKCKEDNIPCYLLSKPYNLKKIQRRNFFRVDLSDIIQVKNITGLHESKFSEVKFKETHMIDLSAGGVRIITNEKYNLNDILYIKMNIKESEIRVKGQVVRYEERENMQRIYGVKFLDISQTHVDKIIEELFQIIRKRRATLD